MKVFDKIRNKINTKEAKNSEQFRKKYSYRVTVGDPLGESFREIKTFGANKQRSEQDNIVWLMNEQQDFQEYFPLDNESYTSRKIEEIDKELQSWHNKKLKPGENKLNKEQAIHSLEKQRKALDTQGGSYMKIDKDGVPHIYYMRYRTSFIPMKWNLDCSLVHVPVEPLTKSVVQKERQKSEKYAQNKQTWMTWGMVAWFVILIIWTGVAAWGSWYGFAQYDQSNIAKLNNQVDQAALTCAEMYGQAGENFIQASQNVVNLTESVNSRYNPKPDTEVRQQNPR